MNELKLEKAINKIKYNCKINNINFIIVGSIAYKIGEPYDDCDDLDCIIVYENVEQLNDFPYISNKLLKVAKYSLNNNKIDLFATKFELFDIKISMDFISINYLEKMSKSTPKGYSEFLRKLTDANELPTNDYYNFYGDVFIYNKIKYNIDKLNVYLLPKFIYREGKFFTGVLYNKFLHNPKYEFIIDKKVITLNHLIVKNYSQYYKDKKSNNINIDITKSIRRWQNFSSKSKEFIKSNFEININN